MINTMKTQADLILSYLRSGNGLTQLESTHYFSICCLAERIRDLREKGYSITSQPIIRNGKRFVRYLLG